MGGRGAGQLPRSGVTDGCDVLWVLGIEPGSSERQSVLSKVIAHLSFGIRICGSMFISSKIDFPGGEQTSKAKLSVIS
ncbi:hypothetical protein ACRRTK_019246 [Alexandromys fortis]